jgi:uncharacterized membrane protein (Fun14 family)
MVLTLLSPFLLLAVGIGGVVGVVGMSVAVLLRIVLLLLSL